MTNMKPSFQYDVFLSHNKADKPWVRGLYSLLTKQNLSVFFDEESIDFGEDTVTAIDKALDGSKYILLVVTPNSMASRWIALEASISIYADPNAAAKKLIPILLEPTPLMDIPATVRRLNTVDLTNPTNRTSRIKKLLTQLGISVTSMFDLPVWPSGSDESSDGKAEDKKDIFRFRNPAIEWYVARSEQSLVPNDWLASNSHGSNLLITGRTGVGKSSFLAWLSNQAKNEGNAVLHCVPSSDRVDDLLLQLARQEAEFLSVQEIKAPEPRGIPKLDHQDALARLLQRTTKHIVIVIDQVERLFPYAAIGTGEIYNTWRMLMEAIGDFRRDSRVTWVLAVKEWYFLMLFPSEMQLRMDNFTYISLSDLKNEESASLVRRLASLSGITVGHQEIDLLVTRTGGRPVSLVLCFLVAVERAPDKRSLGYDYLSKTEPWNEIFAADYARLQSQKQRCIALALAFSKKEVVPEEQVFRRVEQAERCVRSDVEKEIQRLDQDFGLLVRKEGYVSFVHSGFGVFLDNKYSSHYPKEWVARPVDELDEPRRKEFQIIGSKAINQTIAVFAHTLNNILPFTQEAVQRLRRIFEEKQLKEEQIELAHEISNGLSEDLDRLIQIVSDFRRLGSPKLSNPNANTVLLEAVNVATQRLLHANEAIADLRIDVAPEVTKLRVPGDFEIVAGVFTELFHNSVEHSMQKVVQITVKCFLDPSTNKLICDVRDNGCGISAESQERMFEEFFTTKPRNTGLGLAFVKRIMDALGGSIREIGITGEGATFRLEFPLFESH